MFGVDTGVRTGLAFQWGAFLTIGHFIVRLRFHLFYFGVRITDIDDLGWARFVLFSVSVVATANLVWNRGEWVYADLPKWRRTEAKRVKDVEEYIYVLGTVRRLTSCAYRHIRVRMCSSSSI